MPDEPMPEMETPEEESGKKSPVSFGRSLASALQRRMLIGLVTIIPLACVLFVFIFSINKIHAFFKPVITKTIIERYRLSPEELVELNYPPEVKENSFFVHIAGQPRRVPKLYVGIASRILAIFLFVSALYIIGLLSGTFIVRRTLSLSESIVERIPGLKTVYRGSKQLVETVVNQQKQTLTEVILIEYPRKNVWVVGYVTGSTLLTNTGQRYLNIFIPTTPNPTSGFFVLCLEEEILYTNLTIEEAVKYVVSAGIVVPEDIKAVPYRERKSIRRHPRQLEPHSKLVENLDI